MLGHILHAIYTGLVRSNVKEAIVLYTRVVKPQYQTVIVISTKIT